MAAHGVLDHLDQGLHLGVEELRVEPGRRAARAHQGASDGGVQAELGARLEVGDCEALEVRALPSLHVDHLEPVALGHLVGPGRAVLDDEVLAGIGQRRGQQGLNLGSRRIMAVHVGDQVGGRRTAVGEHGLARRDDHAGDVVMGHHPGPGAGGSVAVEDPQRRGGLQHGHVDADTLKSGPDPAGVLQRCGEDAYCRRLPGGSGPAIAVAFSASRTEQAGIGSAGGVERHQLARLTSLGIDDLQLVAGVERQDSGAAAGHPVALDSRSEHQQPRHQDSGLVRHSRSHGRLPRGDELRGQSRGARLSTQPASAPPSAQRPRQSVPRRLAVGVGCRNGREQLPDQQHDGHDAGSSRYPEPGRGIGPAVNNPPDRDGAREAGADPSRSPAHLDEPCRDQAHDQNQLAVIDGDSLHRFCSTIGWGGMPRQEHRRG